MHFNVQAATIDKLQSYLEDKLAALDMVSKTPEDMVILKYWDNKKMCYRYKNSVR